MRKAYISLLGLLNADPDLFSDMHVPAVIDKDVLVAELISETADLEVVYPDPEIMRQLIENWSYSRMHAWNKIATVLYEEYDPFINIKRDEVRTIESSGENETGVSAWNESDYTNRDKNKGSSFVRETFHVEGDSAITDAQDVARKEVDLRLKMDLYQIILREFINRFCLLVY